MKMTVRVAIQVSPVSERDAYPNRVLLCPTHHTQADKDNGIYYSVEQLHEMKRQHEEKVRFRLNAGSSEEEQSRRRREEALLEAASLSRGRLIARWISAGVSGEVAQSLADDESIGNWTRVEQQLPRTGLIFIEGNFGSGKSVTVERLHAEDIKNALRSNSAPLPIYLAAQFISGTLADSVREAARPLGDLRQAGIRVIIDGLDKPSSARALKLLDEVRTLALAWPRSRFVVTTRPGFPLNQDERRVRHPPLSDDEAAALVERLGGHRSVLWADSAAVRDMLRLPLFTIVAVLRQQAGAEVPRSQGAFLEALANKALERTPSAREDAFAALRKLAVLAVGLGGLVPAAELDDDVAVRLCLESRLVVREGRALRFALPVVEQYFAAQALLDAGITLLDTSDLISLDKWRYPLILAVTLGSWNKVTTIIEAIVIDHPGFASWIVANATPDHGQSSNVQLPEHLECARKFRVGMEVWIGALEPVAPMLGLTDESGKVRTVGAHAEGGQLAVALKVRPVTESDVERLPHGFNPFTAEASDGSVWGPVRVGGVAADFPAWPWRLALNWLSNELEDLLMSKTLALPGSSLYQVGLVIK